MSHVLALVVVVLVVVAQWFFTRRAMVDRAHFAAWVGGGYVAKILLLSLGLYLPRALGVDVRAAAIGAVVAVIVASAGEAVVMARAGRSDD